MAKNKVFKSMDGNEAASYAAYAFTEVSTIYPITPSSPMIVPLVVQLRMVPKLAVSQELLLMGRYQLALSVVAQ